MYKPVDTENSKAQHLLRDLTQLHQQLAGSDATDPIPVLNDAINTTPPNSLNYQHELLIYNTEKILQEIIQEFTPLIAQELSRRMQQYLRSTQLAQVPPNKKP